MNSTFIIAEAGVNHNGSLATAKKLVDAAVAAHVDAIKFQTFVSEDKISRFADKAEYQKAATGSSETQLQMIKKLELSFDAFKMLQLYCQQKDILFLSTPFDMQSVEFIASLNMPFFKIPSGEITNLPHLLKVASYGKPVILSTGMSTLEEVEEAVNILTHHGVVDITLLQCNTQYPTPYKDVNLKAMLTMKEKFGCKVGYSDHTTGIDIPVAAVALGASVIEKHFTLDRNMEGPDHKASLEPSELAQMVQSIRHVEQAMGDGIKRPMQSEIANIPIARTSIVAKTQISAEELFTENNITVKRPGNGISPMRWYEILGKKAGRNFYKDELIEL